MKRLNRRLFLKSSIAATSVMVLPRHVIGLYLFAAFGLLGTPVVTAANDLVQKTGFSGGLVVHVGAGDTELAQRIVADYGNSVVQVLLTDRVMDAREALCERKLLRQIIADSWSGLQLPQVDDSVNLLIVESPIEPGEISRVLAPGGTALIKDTSEWKAVTQPRPRAIDDWTHYLYDAGNNPVSKDTKVAAPKHLQWWAPPKYSRSHEIESTVPIAVTAGGRIVYIVDEGLTGITDPRLPEQWALVGRGAFSGVKLWRVPLPKWGWPQWRPERADQPFNIQDYSQSKPPVSLSRRLVMNADHVFITLGWQAPVSMLDAVTGKALATLEGTVGTQEILHDQGIIYALVNDDPNARRNAQNHVVAVDTKTKKVMWTSEPSQIQPEMFAVQGDAVYYQTIKETTCLNRADGQVKWKHAGNWRSDYYQGGTGLIATKQAVYLVNRRSLLTLDPASGKVLWKSRGMAASAGGNSPNVFEVNGLLWGAYGPRNNFQGLNTATGKPAKKLNEGNVISQGHHIRCFRAKATPNYIIWPYRGTEFLGLDGKGHSRHDWIRGSCRYGSMPANGMLYVPPHQCFCYQGSLLNGFMAIAPNRETAGTTVPVLQKGPAFKYSLTGEADAADWPCYRRTNLRLGSTTTRPGTKPTPDWSKKLGGRLAPPALANGRLYVIQTQQGIVNALDAETGRASWRFITGSRIDSPPTIVNGCVLFGCADGHVYCLRALDGALVWRFRAAPHERRIVVDDRLESPWPVGGSVLMLKGLAYVVAGRSSYLDGGLYLHALDPATGQVKHSHNYAGPNYEEGKKQGRGFEMEGCKGDLLSTDGERIYLFGNNFSLDLKRESYEPPDKNGLVNQGLHVITTGGWTDDEGWNRHFWTYSKRWPGFYFGNQSPKAGQLLVVDEKCTYAIKQYTTRNLLSPMFFPQTKGYLLFADHNDNEPILTGEPGAPNPIRWLPEVPNHERTRRLAKFDNKSFSRDKQPGYSRAKPSKWQTWIPVRVRAMVRTGNSLFVAGPPDILKEGDKLAAFQGRAGAKLLTVDPESGKVQNELDLQSPPVFDGLIAAQGHLYMCTRSGAVVRFR
jgi:outer membrane protein assembly factor BamB